MALQCQVPQNLNISLHHQRLASIFAMPRNRLLAAHSQQAIVAFRLGVLSCWRLLRLWC